MRVVTRSVSTLALFWVSVLMLAGCQGLQAPPLAPSEPESLDQARARWAEARVAHYEMVIQQRCFCPPAFSQPVRMRVLNGEIVALEGLQQPIEQLDRARRQMKTVDRLLEFIDWAERNEAYIIKARYNPRFGYPEVVRYDGHARIADDEFEFRISEFTELPPP